MHEIQFQELINSPTLYEGENVIVKGFLYQTSDGQTVIAGEPNLKNCCIGTNKHPQIIVFGKALSSIENQMVTLKGTFYSKKGSGYQLIEATMLPASFLPIGTVGTACLGFFFIFVLTRKRWRKFSFNLRKSS